MKDVMKEDIGGIGSRVGILRRFLRPHHLFSKVKMEVSQAPGRRNSEDGKADRKKKSL